MNRVQPTEKQLSMAIFFSHWWTNFLFFFNRQNFEQAVLDIQIWVGLLHNIKMHKCYFKILKYCTSNKREDYQRDAHTLSANFILVLFVAWLTLHCTGKNYNCYIKSCTFYRPDKVFSREHSNTKLIHWRSAGKLELSTR